MPDREGSDPTDEKPVTAPEEEAPETEAPETEDEQPIQDGETVEEEAPETEADPDFDPLANAFSEPEDEPEDEPEATEVEEEEPEEEAPESTTEHLYNLPDKDWKGLSQQGRNDYLAVRKDAEQLRQVVDTYNGVVADLGLEAEEAGEALQLMATLKKEPEKAADRIAKYAPDLVAPKSAGVPQDLVEELGKALEEVDLDSADAAFAKLKELATEAPKGEAPAPETKSEPAPAATGPSDEEIWETMSAATGIDDPNKLGTHLRSLGQSIVARMGRVPEGKEIMTELLREHRSFAAEEQKKAQAPKGNRRPVRGRAPKAAAAPTASNEPLDPTDPSVMFG